MIMPLFGEDSFFSKFQTIENELKIFENNKCKKRDVEKITKLLITALADFNIGGLKVDPSIHNVIHNIDGSLRKLNLPVFKKRQTKLNNLSIIKSLDNIILKFPEKRESSSSSSGPHSELSFDKEKPQSKEINFGKKPGLLASVAISEDLSVLRKNASEEIARKKSYAVIKKDGTLRLYLEKEKPDDDEEVLDLNNLSKEVFNELSNSQKNNLLNGAIYGQLPHLVFYLLHLDIDIKKRALGGFNEIFLKKMIRIFGVSPEIVRLVRKKKMRHQDLQMPSFENKNIKFYKRLMRAGCPITIDFFKGCLEHQNLPFIDFVLKRVNQTWLEKHSKSIINTLLNTLDENSANMIFERYPKLGEKCTLKQIYKASSVGKNIFIIWMLSHGMKIGSKNLRELINKTIDKHDLFFLWFLCEYAQNISPDVNANYTYPEILGLDKIDSLKGSDNRNNRYGILLSFALNSPMEEVYTLVDKYPEFMDVLPLVRTIVSLLVRFPPHHRAEINKKYSNRDEYIKDSEEYAKQNYNFIQNIIPTLKDLSREELLDEIVKDRCSRNINLDADYSKKTIEQTANYKTPIVGRYYKAKTKLMINFYFPSIQKYHFNKNQSVQVTSEGLRFTYPLSVGNTKEDVPITKYFWKLFRRGLSFKEELHWRHCSPESISKLQKQAEKLHRELLDYKLNLTDPVNKKLFFEKVAEAYWLAATLCERLRGTPHNAMMYLNIIYAYHGLPFPIPKLEYYFLDNVMLVTPIEVVKKNWHQYFEPLFDDFIRKKEKMDEKGGEVG